MNTLRAAVMALAALAVAHEPAHAERSLPRLPESGESLQSFVPPGHRLEEQVVADLDGDGIRDAVLVVVPACAGDGADVSMTAVECRARGRFLAIVLGRRGGGYRLSIAKPIESGIGVHGDDYYGMNVRGRTVLLEGGWASATARDRSQTALRFRYQGGEWLLIGQDEETWRARTPGAPISNAGFCPELRPRRGETCIGVRRSTNFSTGAVESVWTVQGEDDDDEDGRTVVVRKTLPRAPLTRLADMTLEF